jgi:hypothetical protein
VLAPEATDAWLCNHLAWLFASRVEARLNDPARAVELAKATVALKPENGP